MSPASVKASSLYSEAKMADSTRVKFDVPIGTWGQTQVEVEYPWHRDLDSLILPLLETAHEQQAERQRKHRDSQPERKSGSKKTRSIAKPERGESSSISRIEPAALPMRPNEDIKLFLKGFESARDLTAKRGETFQSVLETYAQQTEKDVERLELFYKGKHASRGMTPDTGLKTAQNCKSTSSLDSSSPKSTQSREIQRSLKRSAEIKRSSEVKRSSESKRSSETQNDGIERGSILVANGITIHTTDIDGRSYSAPAVPEKSPLRTSMSRDGHGHIRTPSWASGQTTTSDKALKLLGIDTNELAHQLAQIDSVIPLQHFSSGSVTQVDLHPGPSRLARQHVRKTSAMSDRASPGGLPSVTTEEPSPPTSSQQNPQDELALPYVDHDDVSSLHDSLSPIKTRRTVYDEAIPKISFTSSEKARKLLGVDRPDYDPGPGGRQGSTYGDYERKTRSYPTGYSPTPYPTEVTSYAHPHPHNCKRNMCPPQRSNAIVYRPRSVLVGIPYEQSTARGEPEMDRIPNRTPPPTIQLNGIERKRTSVVVTPFAEPEERESDDVKLTTTCSGPVVEMAGEEMEPEHAIQFKIKRKEVGKRCPKMSGIVECFNGREGRRVSA